MLASRKKSFWTIENQTMMLLHSLVTITKTVLKAFVTSKSFPHALIPVSFHFHNFSVLFSASQLCTYENFTDLAIHNRKSLKISQCYFKAISLCPVTHFSTMTSILPLLGLRSFKYCFSWSSCCDGCRGWVYIVSASLCDAKGHNKTSVWDIQGIWRGWLLSFILRSCLSAGFCNTSVYAHWNMNQYVPGHSVLHRGPQTIFMWEEYLF